MQIGSGHGLAQGFVDQIAERHVHALATVEQAVIGIAAFRRRVEFDHAGGWVSLVTTWAVRRISRRVPSKVLAAGFVACRSSCL
jgi:hypothetical protein